MSANKEMVKVRRSFSLKFKIDAVKLAEATNANSAARTLGVDQKRIREWKQLKTKLETTLQENGTGRKRLSGGGKKLSSEDTEFELVNWITGMRSAGNRVTRKMIKVKAKEIFSQCDDATRATLNCSEGWLEKFMLRNGFSTRRVTSVAQKAPEEYEEKIASFVMFVDKTRMQNNISDSNIIAMDETAIFFDMLSSSTVDKTGTKTVTIHSTGHEKCHATVVLAAAGDGRKLKPFVVFKQGVREVKAMQDMKGVKIVSTKSGWMDDGSTCEWLDSVFRLFNNGKRLLVWDSYRCHLSVATKSHLKGFNTRVAVVPGGCTKYVQAPDLSWNKPFKSRVKELYDMWMASDEEKELTRGGNLKAPNKRLIVSWILNAWEELPSELIQQSFKATGITVAHDGSEDNKIHCMKFGEPCHGALQILSDQRLLDSDMNEAIVQENIEIDVVEMDENEIVIYEDDI